ncbi:MAG: ATP-binding cassette domain-containing protein [Chloroflexi bacterium]|nr:MAG: ATP-binding cassette domain-containing protein [Chloroflexota bacterium]
MEAQGFSAESDRTSTGLGRRLAMLVGVLGVVCGLFVMRYWPQRLWAGWAFIGLGAAVFLTAGWGAGPAQKRTRYRAEHLGVEDAVTIAAAAITLSVVGTLTLVRPGLLDYSPYPRVLMPAFRPPIGLALVLLATPALVARRKTGEQQGTDTEMHQPTPFILASGVRVPKNPLIEVQNVSYWYPDSKAPALRGVSLSLTAGEFTLVIGPSGAGKSTFLRLLNGLVPHFTGGTIAGTVRVAGRDPVAHGTSKMAHIAGFVFQDPEAQFVTEQVEDELVFALENHGFSRAEIERRLAWVLDVLDLHHLRQRRVDTLSGGERQRVAIGSVLALQPQVLILDEPTSQLDPASADEVLRAVTELNRRLGLTVVLAEHRLERVLPYADKVVYFPGQGQTPVIGRPRDVMEKSDLVPPIVNLARTLGWHPLPLTIEEARGHIERSNGKERVGTVPGRSVNTFEITDRNARKEGVQATGSSAVALRVSDLWYAYDGSNVPALRGVSLEVAYGETVAIVGPNGAGKTTLLRCVMGLIQPEQGEIEILGQDRRTCPTEELAQQVGFVPQNAGAMLFADSVWEEVAYTRRSQHLPPDGREVLETFGLMPLAEQYPWDLSVGERQRVAIAAFLAGEPRFLLLDEPTRGLDYRQKATLTSILRQHQAAGHATLLVTHDVELVAAVADRMVILEDGQVVAEGPTSDVMRDHPRFASQISRLFNDGHAEG